METRRFALPDSVATAAAALGLVLAVVWAAPQRVIDADALSRLAMGRLIVQHGVPAHDPWTFSAPDVRFGDPEWLGDLGWYAVFSRFGERGLQSAAISCACLGFVLALLLGRALGGRPASLLAMFLCTLPVAAARISPRNDVHLFWLFPLLGLLCLRTQARATWIALLGLGLIWANLHSSFLLAWVFLLLPLALSPDTPRRWAWPVALAYPLLPWLGPGGASSYVQLLDHVRGASVYRALLSEWQSPLSSSGWLAILPLYVLSALGLAALIAMRQRLRPWSWCMFVMGTGLAFASRRFLPALAYLTVPAIGIALHEGAQRLGRARLLLSAFAGLVVAAYLILAARSGSARERPSVFALEHGPERAIDFVRAHAPSHSRVANAFNDGPWLLWLGEGVFTHYLDPRNNLGAQVLERYVHDVLADADAFEREAERLDINLALVPQRDPSMRVVRAHLMHSSRWRMTFWDGSYAVYARDEAKNHELLARYGYRVLEPTLDLRYLSGETPDLAHDLAQLDATYAGVIRAYLQLREAGGAGPRAVAAANVIAAAWPMLPDTTELNRALAALPQPAR